jgi:hypothetical protein
MREYDLPDLTVVLFKFDECLYGKVVSITTVVLV